MLRKDIIGSRGLCRLSVRVSVRLLPGEWRLITVTVDLSYDVSHLILDQADVGHLFIGIQLVVVDDLRSQIIG